MTTRRVCSVSGGKDSTATYLLMLEQGKDFDAVFADTGHEHPVTINYVRNLPAMTGGPKVQIVKADFSAKIGDKATGRGMLDLVTWKKRAPSARAQFCTEHLKMHPIRLWLERMLPDGVDAEMYIGIRAAESERRSKMPESEWSNFYDCMLYRPILKWSEEQVWDILKRHSVPPNPLYTEAGVSRVGCYPCIHARKQDLATMPDWAWDRLREYEAATGRSWFSPGRVPGVFIPTIDQVKEWSKTAKGGVQIDAFAPEQVDVPSCMSTWGVCE